MTDTQPRRPRATTIVWGVILLLAAALAMATTLFGMSLGGNVALWLIVGFGGLLVLAGITGAIVQAVLRSLHDHTLE
jgi:hypothetical protein